MKKETTSFTGCGTEKKCCCLGALKMFLKMLGLGMCLLPVYMFVTSICFYLLIQLHNWGATKWGASKGFRESFFALVN
jgi:hypothetical protein